MFFIFVTRRNTYMRPKCHTDDLLAVADGMFLRILLNPSRIVGDFCRLQQRNLKLQSFLNQHLLYMMRQGPKDT